MKVEDEEKNAFITPYGVYCYMTMPFGLKNAGATYQRMMQACNTTTGGSNQIHGNKKIVLHARKVNQEF
jgi:hypothetical protein